MFSIRKVLFFMALSLVFSFQAEAKAKAAKAAAVPVTPISCPNRAAHADQTFPYSQQVSVGGQTVCLQWCQADGPQKGGNPCK